MTLTSNNFFFIKKKEEGSLKQSQTQHEYNTMRYMKTVNQFKKKKKILLN